MPYDTNRTVVDDVDDNLAQYYNEQGTSIAHVMSSVPYSNYGTTTSSSGTITLTDSSFPMQSIAPGTANVVLFMPAVGTANHPFYVVNNGTAGYTIQAKTSGSAIIGPPIPANGFAAFISDSVSWYCDGWHDVKDGEVLNGKITPSISSNNLIVTLQTRSGGDPSTTDAVVANIGGTFRVITAPLSVTISAGTSTFNAGAAELATQTIPLFPYLSYKTSAGSVVIGLARIPYARLYSEFNGTATNERYAAFSAAPASTDTVINVGYFEAINSGSASYNWSMPTPNTKQGRTIDTNRMYWAPTPTGYSTNPTPAVYEYLIKDRICSLFIREQGAGTSNATTLTYTLPFSAVTTASMLWDGFGSGIDNSAALTTAVRLEIASAGTILTAFPNMSASSTWTASAQKRIGAGQITYPIG